MKSKEPIEDITYADAVAELETILHEIETGETDIDVLSGKVKRALFLIQLCRSRLRHTDDEVRKLIAGFEKNEE